MNIITQISRFADFIAATCCEISTGPHPFSPNFQKALSEDHNNNVLPIRHWCTSRQQLSFCLDCTWETLIAAYDVISKTFLSLHELAREACHIQ